MSSSTAATAAPLAPAVVDAGTLAAIDDFVDTVIDGVYDSHLDAYDVQEWAVDRGIIARVECGGMDGDCEICAESDTDYHYTRVLYAQSALAAAALTPADDAGAGGGE